MEDKIMIILGGGLHKNDLPVWVKDRCNCAINYYNKNKDLFNIKIIATSGGSPHYPNPRDKDGHTIHECDIIIRYLIDNHVPKNILFKEWTSYDTIGNAYFSKLLLVDVFSWENLLIITNDFHMERSKAIFEYIFNDQKYNLNFISIPYYCDDNILKKRLQKEQKSLNNFKNLIKTINNFDIWLYTEHQCYNITNNPTRLQEKLLYS